MGNYPVAFSKEVAGCVDKGRAVNVHLDFSKAFDMVFCSLLIAELKTGGLEKRIIGCVENWLGHHLQRSQQYNV